MKDKIIELLHEIADEFKLVLLSEEIVDIATRIDSLYSGDDVNEKKGAYLGAPGFEHLPNDVQESGAATDHIVIPQPISEERIEELWERFSFTSESSDEDFTVKLMTKPQFVLTLKELNKQYQR